MLTFAPAMRFADALKREVKSSRIGRGGIHAKHQVPLRFRSRARQSRSLLQPSSLSVLHWRPRAGLQPEKRLQQLGRQT